MRIKSNAWIVLIYAVIVLAGGLAGYATMGSKISLYAGCTSFILLGISSIGIYKAKTFGYMAALILILILDAFFTFRYMNTLKFIPSGLMALLSLLTLLILIFRIRQAAKK